MPYYKYVIILGAIEDQLYLIVWGLISSELFKISDSNISQFFIYQNIFSTYINPLSSNQPLIWLIFSAGLSIFGVSFYNFYILTVTIINFLCAYLLFREYRNSVFYSLVFAFSSYYWIHFGRHIDLMNIWVFPVFLLMLKKGNSSPTRNILLGLFIVLVTMISNYYGFMLILIYLVLTFWKWVFLNNITSQSIKSFLQVLIPAITVILLILFPYIKSIYFPSKNIDNIIEHTDAIRPIEDFFTFSSRPWYFFLPPSDNPWLGKITERAVSALSSFNYFLFDDYFSGEHSGNYMGIMLYLFGLIVLVYFVKHKLKNFEVLVYLFTVLTLFAFMMPPFFTISGIKFYTPGYLIYLFFPMFRVTSRMSILLLIILLLIIAEGIKSLDANKIKFKWQKFTGIFLVLILLETFSLIKVTKISSPPEWVSVIKNTEPSSRFAVYPFSLNTEAMLWLSEHKKNLINPRYFNFNDQTTLQLTNNLQTMEGLKEFQDLGGKYLVVSKNLSGDEFNAFSLSPKLKIISNLDKYVIFVLNTQ